MAEWHKTESGLVTYYGHGRILCDSRLKEILFDLATGEKPEAVAKRRGLHVAVIRDIIEYFQKHSG